MVFWKHSVWILLLSLAVLGCKEQEHTKPMQRYTLNLSDTLYLQLDSLNAPKSNAYHWVSTDSGQVLARLNMLRNALELFDGQSGSLLYGQEFARGGRYGSGDIISLYVEDSGILLLNPMRLSLGTFGSPEISANLHVDWPAFGEQAGAPYRPISVDEDFIYIPFMGVPGIRDFANSKGKSTHSLMVKIERQGGYENLMSWPSKMEKEEWPNVFLDYSVSPGHEKGFFIYSFPSDADLLYTDLEEEIRHIKAGGNFPSLSHPPQAEPSSDAGFPRFGPVYFDAYRGLYLRFIFTGTQDIRLLLFDTDFQWINDFSLAAYPPLDVYRVLISEKGWHIRALEDKATEEIFFHFTLRD
jgi:hypothetical protein